MPRWQELYTLTMLETNAEHLDRLIEETMRALDARLDELLDSKGHDEERAEIREASKALLILKADRRLWNRGGSS